MTGTTIFIRIVATLWLFWTLFNVLSGPFYIGRKLVFTANGYMFVLLRAAGTLTLIGRCLGWW